MCLKEPFVQSIVKQRIRIRASPDKQNDVRTIILRVTTMIVMLVTTNDGDRDGGNDDVDDDDDTV